MFYAIGRHSRSDSSVVRLLVDMSQPSSAGKSAAVLQFSNRREAEAHARSLGDWFFVVTVGKVAARQRTARTSARKAVARKAAKKTTKKGKARRR